MKKSVIFGFLIGIFLLFNLLFISTAFVDNGSLVQNVTDCGTLNTTNATYTLNQSINSSYDCLIINATNITLNCAGYNITYGNSTGGWGIAVVDENTGLGADNVTIKNCLVIQNESAANETAIFFGEYANNSVVYNNTIIVNGNETNGISFEVGSVNASASLNNITTSGNESHGISIGDNSVNANVSLNNVITSGNESHGIVLWEGGSSANISSNTVTTSGNDSSGIRMQDSSSSSLVFNNTIVNSGNWSSIGMGGILLEVGTYEINVSSNNITMLGVDIAGIWIWGDNSSIEHNIITTSGELGDGIFLGGVQGINLTSNTITLSGGSGDGIHAVSSENPLLFYNNLIITSGNYSYGINLDQDSNNNISLNNITTSGISSYGMFFNQSHNTTVANNRVTTGQSTSYVLYLTTSANETVYNNIFNTSTSGSGVYIETSDLSYFNTTSSAATNILGRSYVGGNFWTNLSGTGFSDTCIDSGGDYLCDSAYSLSDEGTDYLPLADHTNAVFASGALSIANYTYYLNQSIDVGGTCFDITANNITLNFNGFNITGNTTGEGINITDYNDTKILNGLIYNFSNGIFLNNSQNSNITNITLGDNNISLYIDSSSSNIFSDITINNYGQNGVYLNGTASSNNNFTDVTIENTVFPYYDIEFGTEGINGTWVIDSLFTSYSFVGAGGIVNFKVSSSAIIEFLEPINGSGTNLTLGDLNVENNLIFVNSSSNSGLNKSANITLYGIAYTDPKPQYSSDEITFTDCTATTNPACSELGFSGNAFKFNTTHFTYFRSAEAYVAPSSGPGGGGSSYSFWNVTYVINDSQFKQGYTKELAVRSRIQVSINKSNHYIGVIELTNLTAKVNVSSIPQQATFLDGDVRRFDVNGDDYYDIVVTLNEIVNNKASITVLSISEKITSETEKEEQDKEKAAAGGVGGEEENIKNGIGLWKIVLIIFGVVIVLILIRYIILKKKKDKWDQWN